MATDQVLFGESAIGLHATDTKFSPPNGTLNWNAEAIREMIIPSAGTIRNLYIELASSPGSGKSYTFALMVDGVASDLTTAIADSATTGNDTTHVISVSAGQRVSLRATPSNSPATPRIVWTLMFRANANAETAIMGLTPFANFLTRFTHVSSITGNAASTDESEQEQLVAGSGTIKNLYILLSADPGDDPEGYRITVRKNRVNQSLTVTITADDVSGNDTVNSFTVAPGDLLSISIEPLNTPLAMSMVWGMTFVADTDGESMLIAATDSTMSNSATKYNRITAARGSLFVDTESLQSALGQNCTLRDLYIDLETAPGAGTSRKFTLFLNGVATSLTVTISDTAKTGSDTINSVTVAIGDEVSIETIPTNTPDSTKLRFGLVQFNSPIIRSPSNIVSAVLAENLI